MRAVEAAARCLGRVPVHAPEVPCSAALSAVLAGCRAAPDPPAVSPEAPAAVAYGAAVRGALRAGPSRHSVDRAASVLRARIDGLAPLLHLRLHEVARVGGH